MKKKSVNISVFFCIGKILPCKNLKRHRTLWITSACEIGKYRWTVYLRRKNSNRREEQGEKKLHCGKQFCEEVTGRSTCNENFLVPHATAGILEKFRKKNSSNLRIMSPHDHWSPMDCKSGMSISITEPPTLFFIFFYRHPSFPDSRLFPTSPNNHSLAGTSPRRSTYYTGTERRNVGREQRHGSQNN